MSAPLPEPESTDLGRYLEDTIVIDWQTPAVAEKASRLIEGADGPEARVERIFRFVRDEIAHALDGERDVRTCRASEVLKEGAGLCHAQSHLLAALMRFAGHPTGFCYARVRDDVRDDECDGDRDERFVVHGFNAVFWAPTRSWIFLDASARADAPEPACRFEAPWSLGYELDVDRGECFLPGIRRRPARRIVDLLERAPSLEAILRNLPDTV